MAVATYSTNLALLTNAQSGTWTEFTGYADGGTPALETDFYIEGTGCYSQSFGTKTGAVFSIVFDAGATQTFATGDCLFIWQICLAGNAIDTFANGGYRVLMGSAVGTWKGYKTGGRDFARNPYGGWQNVAVDPTYTPVDYSLGTATTYRYFGSALNTTAQISKGSPHGVDVIRKGRGDLVILNGQAGAYGNFFSASVANDEQTARWGLFQAEGTGYLWKGLMALGTGSTAVDFRDANRNITIDDTPRTYAAFNKIEIRNTSSFVEWSAVNFSARNASQLSRGQFEMIDNANVSLTDCVFTDMDTFLFRSNATVTGGTFRRCNQITQSGSTFNGTLFTNSTAAVTVLSDNPSLISNATFNSDGSNHAVQFTTAGSYSWTNNIVNNYSTAATGSTGNEVFYNNTNGQVTINVSGGSGVLSVRNGGTSTTTINSTVSVTVTGLKDNTEVRVLASGSNTELAGIEDATSGTVDNRTFTFSLSAATATTIKIHSLQYEHISIDYTVPGSAASIPVQQRFDRNYLI